MRIGAIVRLERQLLSLQSRQVLASRIAPKEGISGLLRTERRSQFRVERICCISHELQSYRASVSNKSMRTTFKKFEFALRCNLSDQTLVAGKVSPMRLQLRLWHAWRGVSEAVGSVTGRTSPKLTKLLSGFHHLGWFHYFFMICRALRAVEASWCSGN